MSPLETPCETHEAQIQENSRKIAELETRANYKDKRINELIENNKRIEEKLDKLTETVNDVIVNSIKDDNNLNQRVTSLETQLKTQNEVLDKFKEDARKEREEDRSKTNLRLAFISIALTVLLFALSYLFK